ncbi:MAG: metallophosphoesterase [Elusimicrobiota bacterium]
MRPSHIPDRIALGHFKTREFAALFAFTGAVLLVFALSAGLLAGLPALSGLPPAARAAIHALSLAGLACMAYGMLIEPWSVRITRLTLKSPKLAASVRVAHVSDVHLRRWSRVEDSLLGALRSVQPDLILVTGDFGSYPTETEDARRLVREMVSIAPTYCSRGNHEYRRFCPMERLQGLGAVWLTGAKASVTIRGARLELVGVDAGDEKAVAALGQGLDPGAYSICLYHFPDLVPELGRLPYDLMLCGHSHGGQVRLPWIGAIISMSRAGRRYTQGLFREGKAAAYINRGVGSEAYGLPRIRFCCPPELACITLEPGPR